VSNAFLRLIVTRHAFFFYCSADHITGDYVKNRMYYTVFGHNPYW